MCNKIKRLYEKRSEVSTFWTLRYVVRKGNTFNHVGTFLGTQPTNPANFLSSLNTLQKYLASGMQVLHVRSISS